LLAEALLVLEIVQQLNNVGPAHVTCGPVPQDWQNVAMNAQLYLSPAALMGLAVALNIFCS